MPPPPPVTMATRSLISIASTLAPDRFRVGAIAIGDEVRGELHPSVRLVAQDHSDVAITGVECHPGEGIEGEDLDVRGAVDARRVEERLPARARIGDTGAGVHGCQQAFAECRLLTAAGGTVPRRGRLEGRSRPLVLADGPQHVGPSSRSCFPSDDGSITTIDHIGLACRDPQRSLRFYRDVLGVEGAVREAADGYVITTPAGVHFTLLRGEPPASMGDFHVGVSLADAAAVRTARTKLAGLGLVEHEWCDEDDYVSVKVLDPDGYVVEVSWDAP